MMLQSGNRILSLKEIAEKTSKAMLLFPGKEIYGDRYPEHSLSECSGYVFAFHKSLAVFFGGDYYGSRVSLHRLSDASYV